jgi:hypothetical protein
MRESHSSPLLEQDCKMGENEKACKYRLIEIEYQLACDSSTQRGESYLVHMLLGYNWVENDWSAGGFEN